MFCFSVHSGDLLDPNSLLWQPSRTAKRPSPCHFFRLFPVLKRSRTAFTNAVTRSETSLAPIPGLSFQQAPWQSPRAWAVADRLAPRAPPGRRCRCFLGSCRGRRACSFDSEFTCYASCNCWRSLLWTDTRNASVSSHCRNINFAHLASCPLCSIREIVSR